LRKLEDLSELQGLRKEVWKIVVALEKLAGIKGQDSKEEQFSCITNGHLLFVMGALILQRVQKCEVR